MEKRKNRHIFIVIIVVIILLLSYFVYKFYLVNIYNTSKYEDRYNKFCELYKSRNEKKIANSNEFTDILNFKDLKFGNILGEYKVDEESEIHKYYTNGNKSILVGQFRSLCQTDTYIKDDKKISMDKFCKKEKIVTDLDFLEYMYNSRDSKISVFSSSNDIQKNWIFKNTIFNMIAEPYNKLTLLMGSLSGYMFEYKNGVAIFLSNGNDGYFISLSNIDYSDSFLKSIYFD